MFASSFLCQTNISTVKTEEREWKRLCADETNQSRSC